MRIRIFSGTDAEDVVTLWNETMVHHPVTLDVFTRKVLLDVNFDRNGFFLAEEKGKFVGFLYAVCRRVVLEKGCSADENKGFIVAMGFRKGPDFHKIGTALLREAETYINRDGKRSVMISGYTPEFFYQGICKEQYPAYAAFLEENGYSPYSDSASMRLDLDTYRTSEQISEDKRRREAEGFYIGPLRRCDIPSLFEYVIPGWRFRYRRLLQEDMDFGKIRVAVLDGQVVGCILFGDPYESAENLSAFSVDVSLRGKSLGKILMDDVLLEMKKRGLHTAWIQWAHYLDAAGAVYRKAGFLQTGIYVTYIKE